ncbi:MAG: AtpZ/AtpI family protein [Alphaproteobacteria bacterium]|nr:MAG: AtpZ/AtpI family protein [Alphaproteobacteria bacterium]
MAALDARLSALEEARAPRRTVASDLNQAQIAWRMVTELMTGVGIGFAMGYGLDALLGTKPWLMMVFALLGMAAGIRVMLATAREVNAAAERARGAGERGDGNGDRRGADAPRTGR